MQDTDSRFTDFSALVSQKDYLNHIARNFEIDRSELLNEVCLKFPGNEARFIGAIDPDAYLARAVRNMAKTLRRKELRFRIRHREFGNTDSYVAIGSVDPPREFEKREAIDLCRAAIARLPERQRVAVVACLLEGQSPCEYARLHNLKFENVRIRLRRAKSSLKHDPIMARWFDTR